MKSSRYLLTLSNFLTALTGGLLLSTTVAALEPDPYFREHGRLAALFFGGLIGFLINAYLIVDWPFRRKASLPLLAVVADGLILALVSLGVGNEVIVVPVFLLLWTRWAFWFTSRAVRVGAANRLEPPLPVHYIEGSTFLGFAVGAAAPLTLGLLTNGGWKAPRLEVVLWADIVLFLAAAVLDHVVATYLPPPKQQKSTSAPVRYPVARMIAMLVGLTGTTQMVLFAYNGSIGQFQAARRGDMGWELLVPAAYAGAAIASLVGGLLGALLWLPGATTSPTVQRACMGFGKDGKFPVQVIWLCVAGAVCSLAALWLSPQGPGPACLAATALAINTIVSNSTFGSIGRWCGSKRLTIAISGYFPLAIIVYGLLSLSVTYAIPDMLTAQWFFTTVGVFGLLMALACSYSARIE